MKLSITATAALTSLALAITIDGAAAQSQCWQGSCLISPYYQTANVVYQGALRRQGVSNPPSIGSPQFFLRQTNYPAVRPSYMPAPRPLIVPRAQPMYVPRAQPLYMPAIRRR